MSGFTIGVISSLASSLIWLLGALVFTSHFRKQMLLAFARISGSGVEYVYANDQDAGGDMRKYALRSRTVSVLSMRAFRLLKDNAPLSFLLHQDCPIENIRILLADADSAAVTKRAEEFRTIDKSYSVKRYIEDIRWSVIQVGACLGNGQGELRLHQEPAFVRLFITDDFLFLSFFGKTIHGDESPVYRISRLSPIYESLTRYFDWVWDVRSSSAMSFAGATPKELLAPAIRAQPSDQVAGQWSEPVSLK